MSDTAKFSLSELINQLSTYRSDATRIVFTNGVFDILHLGHVTYLEAARKLGDFLVVGVNDDASVRRLNKAPERPVNPDHARAGVLSALRFVDAVVIFSEDTPLEIIKAIEPDVLVKGGDYDPSQNAEDHKSYIVGSKEVKERGGEVVSIPLVSGYSTTSIIEKSRR